MDRAIASVLASETWRNTAIEGLSCLCLRGNTETFIRTVFPNPAIVTPDTILWSIVVLAHIGVIDVAFPSQRAAERVKRLCKKCIHLPHMAPACFRAAFNTPLPKHVSAPRQPRITHATVMNPAASSDAVDAVLLRALNFMDRYTLRGTTQTCAGIAPKLSRSPAAALPDVKLFVIMCASFIWQTERNYDKKRPYRKQHVLHGDDPFIEHTTYWAVEDTPPTFADPLDHLHSATLVSVLANTFISTYTGVGHAGEPFNMVGGVEQARRHMVTWIERCPQTWSSDQ